MAADIMIRLSSSSVRQVRVSKNWMTLTRDAVAGLLAPFTLTNSTLERETSLRQFAMQQIYIYSDEDNHLSAKFAR